ncbi:MAG TPA: N-acetylneuraminate synthase [Spirochaetia bacterium]|nr:N-acetylneuraminate synthase [Spirochaetia bacterium]
MKHVMIIAEAGVNHNGDLTRALAMIDTAAACGADAIKFQTYRTGHLTRRASPKAEYQKREHPGETQFEMLKRFELPDNDFRTLFEACSQAGIMFLSTPFDLPSVDLLQAIGVTTWKLPSGAITDLPYLRRLGSLGQKIILSTGMATMDEIQRCLEVLTNAGTGLNDITVLHCTSEYPAPPEEVNLTAMLTIRERFHVTAGYSDHTEGIDIPIAAAALGASVIEKHFTLDKTLPGPDHRASLDPDELRRMVAAIRRIEIALGDGKKIPTPSELKNIPIVRKSIVAALHIKKGEEFTEQNLTTKRPGTGLSPMEWDRLIGTRAAREYQPDDFIELEPGHDA